LWSFFKWFFNGLSTGCGFQTFPSLGIKAHSNRLVFLNVICLTHDEILHQTHLLRLESNLQIRNAVAFRFYFDFSLGWVGTGMLVPHIVNCSILLGAILSWGLAWPLLSKKAGNWYPQEGSQGNVNLGKAYAGDDVAGLANFQGLAGYKVL
jgi:hypothetical protein